jgi:type VI secretion system protein ImpH
MNEPEQGTGGRRQTAGVGPDGTPAERFELFQLVRLLERAARTEQHAGERRAGIGEDGPLETEPVRFRGVVSHRFPKGPVRGERPRSPGTVELLTAVLGLTGPDGVLPRHYTALLMERVRRRDFALRDFLDLFHHRLLSLFYRAWRKHQIPVDYERRALEGHEYDDLFTRCLLALVGLGTPGLRGRDELPDALFLKYAGHFSARTRPASVLEAMLVERFGVPIEVAQFEPQWLRIDVDARSTLPRGDEDSGYNCLGIDVVVGDRVRDLQGRFRVRIGPIPYARFTNFAPGGRERALLVRIVRAYVGPEFDYELQLLLEPQEVPECRLDSAASAEMRLGWNAWVRSVPFEETRGEAVFAVDDA